MKHVQEAILQGDDFSSHRTDKARQDFRSIHLGQKDLDLAHTHASGVQSNDAFIEASKAFCMLGDSNGIETVISVSGYTHTHTAPRPL